MKIMNKIITVALILSVLLLPFSVYASTVSIHEITSQGTPIRFEDGILTKKITNVKGKEITIALEVSIHDKKVISSDSQILFLMDSSSSMNTKLEDNITTRKAKIGASTKELIQKINQNNPNVEMGIMSFSSATQVIQDFTNDKNALLNACDNFVVQNATGNTNMAMALRSAKQKFNANVENKILILLTDGVPTDGANATKIQLQDENTYIISVLTGLNETSKSQITEIFGTEENPTADKFYNIADADIETIISNAIYEKILDNFQTSVSDIVIKDYFPEEIMQNFEIKVNQPTKGQITENADHVLWEMDSLKAGEKANLTYTLKLKEQYDASLVQTILNTNQKVDFHFKNMLGNEENKEMTDSPQIQIITNKTEVQDPEEDKKQDKPEQKSEVQEPEEDKKQDKPEKNPEVKKTEKEDKTKKIENNTQIKNVDNTVKQEDKDNYAKTTLPYAGNSKIMLVPIVLGIIRLIILRKKMKSI